MNNVYEHYLVKPQYKLIMIRIIRSILYRIQLYITYIQYYKNFNRRLNLLYANLNLYLDNKIDDLKLFTAILDKLQICVNFTLHTIIKGEMIDTATEFPNR